MNLNFDFYSKRKIAYLVSLGIIVIGIAFGIVNGGLNLDIQFEGGTLLEIPMKEDNFSTNDIESLVMSTLGKFVTAQKQTLYAPEEGGGDGMSLHLIVKASKSETMTNDEISAFEESLNELYGIREGQNASVRTVEPYIGASMLRRGLLAIAIASALILLYVWVRFSVMSGLSAAVCATAALMHNVLIVLAFFAVFRLPLNDSFIAALLTIIGYSINDTIVVYDRIRENSKGTKRPPYTELVNKSLNQTLTRSLNTTLTTLFAVVTVLVFSYIYNISSLRDFCMPLTVGLLAGVYATRFIASTTWASWQIGKQKRQIAA